jgi:hypothetical protein
MMTGDDEIIDEFRSTDVACSRTTRSDSVECFISSPVRSAIAVVTKPRVLSRTSVSLESVKNRIEGYWSLITVRRTTRGDAVTYALDFCGEDGSLELSLWCDAYRELDEGRKQ